MKFVIQRVKEAKVEVNQKIVGKIDKGFMVLIGITHNDTEKIADFMVKKLLKLRVFEDENEKMNLSLKDVGGNLLLISQFTLYANCTGGNRPDFLNAAKPEPAKELYEYIINKCKDEFPCVQKGIFGANMQVSLVNDGPVTVVLDSDDFK